MASQQTVFIRRATARSAAIVMAAAMVLGTTGLAAAAAPPSPSLTVAHWQLALALGHANAQAVSTLRVKVANAR
jgi:hypothetical protein